MYINKKKKETSGLGSRKSRFIQCGIYKKCNRIGRRKHRKVVPVNSRKTERGNWFGCFFHIYPSLLDVHLHIWCQRSFAIFVVTVLSFCLNGSIVKYCQMADRAGQKKRRANKSMTYAAAVFTEKWRRRSSGIFFFRLLVGSSIKNKTKNVEPHKIEFGQGKVGYCVNKWKPRPSKGAGQSKTGAVLARAPSSSSWQRRMKLKWCFSIDFTSPFFNAFTKKKKNRPKKQDISRETYGLVLSFRSSFA